MPAIAELEDAVANHRDNVHAWSVYADFLQGQGDVRGELIALALKDEGEAKQRIEQLKGELLTPELAALDEQLYDLDWKRGHLDRASMRATYDGKMGLEELTKKLLERPCARFIRTLTFGLASYESDNDWGETFATVCASQQAPRIEGLLFNDYTYEDCEISWTGYGDFSSYWKQVPNLRHLHIRSGQGGTLGTVELPELRKFVRESGGLDGGEIDQICKAKWPKLEWLEIWFGSDGYGAQGSVDSVADVLAGKGLPALRHLGLVNGEFANELVDALAKSEVLKRIKSLDLSKSTLGDDGAEVMMKQAAAFKHLEKIELAENFLSDEVIQRLSLKLPNVKAGEQRTDDDDPEYRYASVGE